ncbi:(4Fe-4S)-binding protein [Cognatitamlana onchidii]|uniref:(4Fe-4S)-binding protein n=1 Tax=Cognatitamlana onchidii TaxID=2562860 RepID=UPI0010A5D226|nr:(4Fe-4S)-binding protein [Algibacter onchidii]
MKINFREFSNDNITITYDPCVCQQSDTCAKQLSNVFRNSVIPWIDIDGAPPEKINSQVKKCPSGALKFSFKNKVA